MSTEPHSSENSALRAATIQRYTSIDTAIAAQRSWETTSLAMELYVGEGELGLHVAETEAEVELNLRSGAPIDGVRMIEGYDDNSEHWETPLLTACVDQRFTAARALIRLGAGVEASNLIRYPNGGGTGFPKGSGFGHTALHTAAVRRDVFAAQLLITAGADLDRQTTTGVTPMFFAAGNDDLRMVRLLLRAGARSDIPNFHGTLPASLAGPMTRPLFGLSQRSRFRAGDSP